jgi:hypothetical protein
MVGSRWVLIIEVIVITWWLKRIYIYIYIYIYVVCTVFINLIISTECFVVPFVGIACSVF